MSKVAEMSPEDAYEVGYREGGNSVEADWAFALSEVLDDDFEITPANVADLLTKLGTSRP